MISLSASFQIPWAYAIRGRIRNHPCQSPDLDRLVTFQEFAKHPNCIQTTENDPFTPMPSLRNLNPLIRMRVMENDKKCPTQAEQYSFQKNPLAIEYCGRALDLHGVANLIRETCRAAHGSGGTSVTAAARRCSSRFIPSRQCPVFG